MLYLGIYLIKVNFYDKFAISYKVASVVVKGIEENWIMVDVKINFCTGPTKPKNFR